MSDEKQLIQILKAIATQQRANTLAIAQLTSNIESLVTQFEEDREQMAADRKKLLSAIRKALDVMLSSLEDDDEPGFDFGLEETVPDLDLSLTDGDIPSPVGELDPSLGEATATIDLGLEPPSFDLNLGN